MKIGDLAKRSGVAPSRIRFYERVGLLKAAERQTNGYRTYPPETAVILNLIDTAQKAGFSLEEIRGLLPSETGAWAHDALLATLRRKVEELQALEARLALSRTQLAALIADIESKPDDIDCAANARRVLSRLLGAGEDPVSSVTPARSA